MIDEYRVKGFGFWEVNGRGFMILLVQKVWSDKIFVLYQKSQV